mmetsp:Transcript_97624/g.223736  ORF Transcript_97624/g.223736 Transcript_97624/m.223736 type:complete len:135 (+) Transcript_97624:257-661(+)
MVLMRASYIADRGHVGMGFVSTACNNGHVRFNGLNGFSGLQECPTLSHSACSFRLRTSAFENCTRRSTTSVMQSFTGSELRFESCTNVRRRPTVTIQLLCGAMVVLQVPLHLSIYMSIRITATCTAISCRFIDG